MMPLPSSSFAFDKTQRLLHAVEFQKIFDAFDFKVHQPNLLLIVKLRDESDISRVGMAITKKKVKRANERNRIKRLIREYFRLHQADFNASIDIVFTVKQTTKSLTNAQITEQIEQAFKQIHYKLSKKMRHG